MREAKDRWPFLHFRLINFNAPGRGNRPFLHRFPSAFAAARLSRLSITDILNLCDPSRSRTPRSTVYTAEAIVTRTNPRCASINFLLTIKFYSSIRVAN
jgi:hypothetical protein